MHSLVQYSHIYVFFLPHDNNAIGLPNEAQVAPSMIVETIEEALAAAEVQLENRLINLRYLIPQTFLESYISSILETSSHQLLPP